MWDGRETLKALSQSHLAGTDALRFDLAHQDDSATLGHEQRTESIRETPAASDLVGFELSLHVAQLTQGSLRLDAKGARGGPTYLGEARARSFFIGENDPAGQGFDREVFRIFRAWEPGTDGRFRPHLTAAQKAIGRGERIFNTRTFSITDVPGLNGAKDDPLSSSDDPLFDKPITGTCSTCHNAFDVGSHSTPLFLGIGVTLAKPTDGAGHSIAGILDIANLPVYSLRSSSGATAEVTDPGRALVTGHFADAGKTKVPGLRGLPARAPYFHNGSAPDLATVIRFYDARFQIGLSEQEGSDLAAFLAAL
jgi:hypothetical protein